MSAVTLPSFEPGSAEWHDQRRRSVGGSEVAAILGIGKWESRFSLWHRKAGTLGPQEDNPLMEWGRRLEPVVLAKFAETHPQLAVNQGGTFTHPDRPWQIASPDAVIGDIEGIVEVKTAHDDYDQLWGEPGTDEIPVYYRTQTLWYLDVLEIPYADVAVLISGSDYREYRVHYDADEALTLRNAAREFLDSIETGERPGIDEHQATYQAIRHLHPEIEPVDVELPAELVRGYCTARTSLDDAKGEAARWTSIIADYMGTAQYAKFAGLTIARRQAKGSGAPFIVAGRNLPTFNESAA